MWLLSQRRRFLRSYGCCCCSTARFDVYFGTIPCHVVSYCIPGPPIPLVWTKYAILFAVCDSGFARAAGRLAPKMLARHMYENLAPPPLLQRLFACRYASNSAFTLTPLAPVLRAPFDDYHLDGLSLAKWLMNAFVQVVCCSFFPRRFQAQRTPPSPDMLRPDIFGVRGSMV